MANLSCEEIKAFVPAKDYGLSCEFYQHIGFELAWQSPEMAYFHHGDCRFLLQNFYNKEHADNFMMHLLVKDVVAWHQYLIAQDITKKYQVTMTEPCLQPWNMTDFVIYDPSGVLWRIGQNHDAN